MAQRKHPKVTQEQIALAVGKDRTYISKLMSGKRIPSLELALRIYEATGEKLGPLKGKAAKQIRGASELLSGAA